MSRIGTIILTTWVFLSSGVLATEITPREISLRTSVIVESEYVTLEDFFGISDEIEKNSKGCFVTKNGNKKVIVGPSESMSKSKKIS